MRRTDQWSGIRTSLSLSASETYLCIRCIGKGFPLRILGIQPHSILGIVRRPSSLNQADRCSSHPPASPQNLRIPGNFFSRKERTWGNPLQCILHTTQTHSSFFVLSKSIFRWLCWSHPDRCTQSICSPSTYGIQTNNPGTLLIDYNFVQKDTHISHLQS